MEEQKFIRQSFGTQISILEDTFFEVIMGKPSEIIPNMNFASDFGKAIYLPSKNKLVHFAGSQYQIVKNKDVVLPLYNELVNRFGYENISVNAKAIDDRKFYYNFILPKVIQLRGKDSVNLQIEVTNSYDGTLKYGYSMGHHRLICRNGLMGFAEVISIKQQIKDKKEKSKHEISSRQTPQELLEIILKYLNENVNSIIPHFEKLSERQVTPNEIFSLISNIKHLSPKSKYERFLKRFPHTFIDEVPQIVFKEAEELQIKPNAWLLYNGFNHILNHRPTLMPHELKEKVDKTLLEYTYDFLQI